MEEDRMTTTYALTSDARSVYRETSGVLVAREAASAMPVGFAGFDHACTDAHHDENLPALVGMLVVAETLTAAYAG